MKTLKLVVEKHIAGYVGYPVGLRGVVVGQGDTFGEALADTQSAVRFHIETFGPEMREPEDGEVLKAFVAR